MSPHDTKPKRARNFQMVPVHPLVEFKKNNALTTQQIAEAIGVTATPVNTWIKKGQMPKIALIALEALKRRQGSEARQNGGEIYFVSVTDTKKALFLQFCEGMGLPTTILKL